MIVFKSELEKRKQNRDNSLQLIGSEIKAKRLALSKTIESIADDCCSTSYLCKIERNTINPNKQFLLKICEKVHISYNSLNTLYDLKNLLERMVKSYYFNDVKTIDEIYQSVSEFNNYRVNLIRCIYYMYHCQYHNLDDRFKELLGLIPNMNDFDIIILGLFYSKYLMIDYKYTDAVVNLNAILDFSIKNEYILALSYEALTEIYYNTNSMKYLDMNKIVIEINTSNLFFKKVKDSYFTLAMFYLKNNFIEKFNKIVETFKEEQYKNSLLIVREFYLNIHDMNNDYNELDFKNEFYYYLYLYKYHIDDFKEKIICLNEMSFNPKEYIILKSLEANCLPEVDKISFIKTIAFPFANSISDILLMTYYMKVLGDYYRLHSQYKSYVELVIKREEVYNNITRL